MKKKKIAVFTVAGCRACENSILDIHYQVNSLSRWTDVLFWPYVKGSQLNDLENLENFDVCFFTGAIRTDKDRETALKLREKSGIMAAVGACAAFGGIPGLINLNNTKFNNTKFRNQESADNMNQEIPLPRAEPRVSALSQIADVDYFIPGCPPTQNFLWAAVQSLAAESPARISFAGSRLPESMVQAISSGFPPPRGSIFAGEKAVCASCSRVKEEKRFDSLKHPYEDYEESGRCLLEQGLICQGIATREGCGGLCTGAGIPCRGCFGKAEAVFDPGAKMVSAISSTFDTEDPGEIRSIVGKFDDLAGMFYRYTLPTQCALLRD